MEAHSDGGLPGNAAEESPLQKQNELPPAGSLANPAVPPQSGITEKHIRRLAVVIPLSGLACAVLLSLTAWTPPTYPDGTPNFYRWKAVIHAIATFTLISGASFFSAALLGFLFGFPRTSDAPDNSPAVRPKYLHNRNIEQISDWLIKMLIGIGLSQMNDFPSLIWRYASHLTSQIFTLGGPTGAAVAASCLILFFLACGFVEGYLATRILLPSRLVAADKESG